MHRRDVRFMWTGVLVLLISSVATAEANSYVEGVLRDTKKDPAVGFTISILGASHSSTDRAHAITDDHGEFHVNNLEFGSYVAAAHLDILGGRYPPGTITFFNKHLTLFTLSKDSPQAKLSMTLDPPCLIISGTITDHVTGLPLVTTINMWHKDDKEKWIRFGSAFTGAYQTWIPPGTTVEMTVSAAHYQEFHTTINGIENGKDPTLDIALEPVPNKVQ